MDSHDQKKQITDILIQTKTHVDLGRAIMQLWGRQYKKKSMKSLHLVGEFCCLQVADVGYIRKKDLKK